MNLNSVKYVGKVKEQIDMEFKARRNYPRKWSKFYNETPWDNMYNPSNLSKQLESEDLNPYQAKNGGDAHFISPVMYKALLANCRCGRPHGDIHLLKCVQKQQTEIKAGEKKENKAAKSMEEHVNKLPQTSSKFVGWQKSTPKYQQWENSMKYYSPIFDMPGERITATPYNAIIIG